MAMDHLVANDLTTGSPDLGKPTLQTRMNFSVPNLISAAMFSRRVGEIESAKLQAEFGSFWDEILANATACIFLTVAGLESYANELFADGVITVPGSSDTTGELTWKDYGWHTLIEKFDLALERRQCAPLKKGEEPVQSVSALVALRNGLMHFKPEWFHERDAHKALSESLRARFKPSPFLRDDPGLFPRAWASHDCTLWALASARTFLEHFEARAGLSAKLTPFIERLKP